VALRRSCIRATSDAQAPVIQAKNGAGQMPGQDREPRPATPTPSPREHSIKVASLNTQNPSNNASYGHLMVMRF